MFPSEIIVIPAIFIGLPWIVLHYVTKWKTAATLTVDDEALLEDLYQLSRRLEDRLDTVERLVRADNPEFGLTDTVRIDTKPLREFEQSRQKVRIER